MKISREWSFGHDKDLAEKLKGLVLSGKKKATTGLYHGACEKLSKAGDYEAIVDSSQNLFCIVQITKVEIKLFLEVGLDFIEKEGESDKNLEEWRDKHRQFFNLTNDNVHVVCVEFELVSI